jgi:hypothetical protein
MPEMVAYKQQKFISSHSGSWKDIDTGVFWSGEAHFSDL